MGNTAVITSQNTTSPLLKNIGNAVWLYKTQKLIFDFLNKSRDFW